MRRGIAVIIGLVAHLFYTANAQVATDERMAELSSETTENVKENMLPFWDTYARDPNGGFFGTLLNDGTPVTDDPKGGVLNARILWTFSRAFQEFGNERYKQMADSAQYYFLRYFIDPVYGGTYWSVKADGEPLDQEKQTYGIAFAIYGLAEHYRATGNETSLNQAIELYRTLERYAYDPVNGGYIESFTRDWQKPKRYGYDGKGIAVKTMNTHLHVLEAYTLLYKVWSDPGLKQQLRGLADIFMYKIIDTKTWHQQLFLTTDWVNTEQIDSYGHDMELSWLFLEAAEALQDEPLIKQARTIALHLVDIQMKEGWNQDGSLLYERENGEVKGGLDWWPQAESVVAFFNAWQISGDPMYLDAAIKTWDWIKSNLVDNTYGEWYGGLGPDGKPDTKRPKANMWKCPYHNSRMAFEIYDRIHGKDTSWRVPVISR
jgi:mannobiose 2-epimerase